MPLPAGPVWGEHLSDARLFGLALAAFAASVLYLGLAAWRHRRNLRAVPIRIHVAGTRGKSTTTRMIAAGLRAGGITVLAKATGSEPRLILPDGNEEVWSRRGPASVREQVRFFAKAARMGVGAAVIECMAIRPELVWASQTHLVQATTAVLTNARPDHFEDVGEDPSAMADALRWVVPAKGRLVVAAEAATPALLAFAAASGTTVVRVETGGLDAHAANRAVALAVCAAHGVGEAVAGPAIEAARADPGLYFERAVSVGGKPIRFANAFACNDVDSFAQIWEAKRDGTPSVVLFNARMDRPLRTTHFLSFLNRQEPTPQIFVAGDPSAVRRARRGAAAAKVQRLRARTPAAALAEVAAAASAGALVWGVGNYQGLGAGLIGELSRPDPSC